MPPSLSGLLVSLVLGAETAAFVLLWLTGRLERFGPTLVAAIMSANLLIVGWVLWAVIRRRKP